MTLHADVTHRVTEDLLTGILTLLPTVSQSLSKTQMHDLITARVGDLKGIRYVSNNDLGLCVDRLTAACEAQGVDGAALETKYHTLRDEDDLVSETMNLMTSGIASRLTSPLYDLRVTLPKEATQFATSVTNRLPKHVQSDDSKTTLQFFNWGKLNDEVCRSSVVLFARDRLNCFKRDAPQSHDTTAILRALPYGSSKDIINSETVKPLLLTSLKDALGEDSDPTLVVSLIVSPKTCRQWFATAKALLSSDPAAAVATITNDIDVIDNTIQCVTTSMLTKLGGDIQVVSAAILENIETIVANIQLLRGAMLYHKDNTLANKLILSPSVINLPTFERFVAAGGTEEMIHNYVDYTTLTPHLVIQKGGTTSDIVLDTRERAAKIVREQATRLRQITAAKRAVALQNTLSYHLDRHNDEKLKADLVGMQQKQSLHKQQKQRALALLTRRPLDEIALEYFVALRDDPLIKPLHAELHKELLTLVEQQSTVTQDGVANATCNAVLTTVLSMIKSKFCVSAV